MWQLYTLLLLLHIVAEGVNGDLRVFTCGFESICTHVQPTEETKRMWSYTDGASAPSSLYPKQDHTYGNASGWYIFTDTTNQWNPAILTTVQNPYYPEKFSFSFAYALSGGSKPILKVKLYHSDSVFSYYWKSNAEAFPSTSPTKWFVKTLKLPADVFAVQLEATINSNQVVAIDDVKVILEDGLQAAPSTIYNCSFESGLCGLGVGEYSTDHWRLSQGLQNKPFTPKVDVTLQTDKGHYIFAGAPNKNSTAFLESPELLVPTEGKHCLEFWKWTTIRLEIQGWIKFYLMNVSDPMQSSVIWPINTPVTKFDTWMLVSIPLSAGPLKLKFVVSNLGMNVQAALDEIRVRQCPIATYEADRDKRDVLERFNCTFEQDQCGIVTRESGRLSQVYPWIRVQAGANKAPPVDRFGNSNTHFLIPGFTAPITIGRAASLKTPTIMSSGSCVEFWLYMHGPENAQTSIAASVGGSVAARVWKGYDGDRGAQWRRVLFELQNGQVNLYIDAASNTFAPLTLAIDDLRIDHCLAFAPATTTTNTSPTTFSTTVTKTSTVSSTTTTLSSSSTTPTTTDTSSTGTTFVYFPTTSTEKSFSSVKPERHFEQQSSCTNAVVICLVVCLSVIALLFTLLVVLMYKYISLRRRFSVETVNANIKISGPFM